MKGQPQMINAASAKTNKPSPGGGERGDFYIQVFCIKNTHAHKYVRALTNVKLNHHNKRRTQLRHHMGPKPTLGTLKISVRGGRAGNKIEQTYLVFSCCLLKCVLVRIYVNDGHL